VKPKYSKEGASSFTVIGKSDLYNGLPRWKVIPVFNDAEDASKNPRMIDVVCCEFHEFVPPHALTADGFVAASVAKKNDLLSPVYGGLYEFDVKFKRNEYKDPILTNQKESLVDLGRDTRTRTQSRRIVRRKDASWSLNWPSGTYFSAKAAHILFWCLCDYCVLVFLCYWESIN